MSTVTAVVDAHVHIHSCYEPDELFSNAYTNLRPPGKIVPPGDNALADQNNRATGPACWLSSPMTRRRRFAIRNR
jgi:hypothetical protein